MECCDNLLYFSNINAIGGTEQWMYYVIKRYKDYEFVICYKNADSKQLERLRKYAKCIKFDGQRIKCKKAFFNYNPDIIDYVDAEEYIQIIHADYKVQSGLQKHVNRKMSRYIAVSKLAADNFTEVTGLPCEVCYNPVEIEKPKRILRLISATRLTIEKGRNRMIKLAKALDDAKIPYEWLVFTNYTDSINNPNIKFLPPELDIINQIAMSDYLVQLSDCEAFCFAVAEALCVGVPVIVTDLPVFNEIGVDETNSIKLPLDMSNIPVKEIYEKKFNFKYTPPKDRWDEIFVKERPSWSEVKNNLTTVTVIRLNGYDDIKEKRHVKLNEVLTVTEERAEYLRGLNLVK